jgi:hypothetical protein
MNLNQELVEQGWCRWYRKYAPGNTVLEGLEKEAREGKKGLWADSHPVPPWEWRKARRDARVHLADTSTLYLLVESSGWGLSDDPPTKWRGFSPVRFCGCTM